MVILQWPKQSQLTNQFQNIKNYNNEIEEFFEWLMPYIDGEEGDFIGYSRYEETKELTLVYLKIGGYHVDK